MAKAMFRQRGRKANHKTRFSVKKGWEAVSIVDEPLEDGESRYEFDDPTNPKLVAGVSSARGVDQGESEEHHLKQVLAARSSTAMPAQTRAPTPRPSFILSSHGGGRVNLTPSPSPTPTPPPATTPYIPVPSFSLVDPGLYSSLYPPDSFADTYTNIRFSDTVEECMEGAVEYTMDEEDEEWLLKFNREVEKGEAERVRNGVGVAMARQRTTIGEDEFELIMEAFEKALDEQREEAMRVNPTHVPSFDTLKPILLRQPALILRPLPPAAEWIYPYWKQRRAARGGRRIIPQLDSNDAQEGPYVCFRRRDVKLARKTRHSDQKKVDRLVAHRNDLFFVCELMKMVLDRQKLRLEETRVDRAVFEKQVEVREFKRRLGEAGGDEDVLAVPERKRRAIMFPKTPSTYSKSSLPSPGHLRPTQVPSVLPGTRKAQKDRSKAISTRLDDDARQRQASDRGWEEATDTAFHSRGVSGGNRYWKMPEPVPGSSRFQGKDGEWREMLGFDPAAVDGGSWRGPTFRLRRGRGGKVMMDRTGLHGRGGARVIAHDGGEEAEGDAEMEELERGWARRLERLKYDDDLSFYGLPTTEDPPIIDDYSPDYLLRRVKLGTWDDIELGAPDSEHLKQAYQYHDQLAAEAKKPAPEIVGRPRPPNPFIAVPMIPLPPKLGATQVRAQPPAEDALAKAGLAVLEAKRVAFQQSQLDKQQKQSQALAQAQALAHLERFSEMNRHIASTPAPTPPVVSFPVQANGSAAPLHFPLPPQQPNGAPVPPHTSTPQLPAAWMAANTQQTPSLSQAPNTANGSLLAPPGFGASPSYGRPIPSSPKFPLPNDLLASLAPLNSPRQQLHGSHTSPVNSSPPSLPIPLPLGANNLPATSRLAAPPLQASLSSSASPSLSPTTPLRRMSATPASAPSQVGAATSPPFSAFPSPAMGTARRAASEGGGGGSSDDGRGGGGGRPMRIVYPGAAGGGIRGPPELEAFLNQLQQMHAQGAGARTTASVGSQSSG